MEKRSAESRLRKQRIGAEDFSKEGRRFLPDIHFNFGDDVILADAHMASRLAVLIGAGILKRIDGDIVREKKNKQKGNQSLNDHVLFQE